MRYLYIAVLSLFIVQLSYADSGDIELRYDKVSVGYIPSRGAVFKGEPYKLLEARTLAHHKNADIEMFFMKLSNLASEGIIDNSTRFHEPVQYIEVIFQGQRVRLSYAGESEELDRFKNYEERWKLLRSQIYDYLSKDISPCYVPVN